MSLLKQNTIIRNYILFMLYTVSSKYIYRNVILLQHLNTIVYRPTWYCMVSLILYVKLILFSKGV